MMTTEQIKKSLDLLQRILDRWYLTDLMDDTQFDSWYAACLKDVAFILLWDDTKYWLQ